MQAREVLPRDGDYQIDERRFRGIGGYPERFPDHLRVRRAEHRVDLDAAVVE
jgi:hypothetical protein